MTLTSNWICPACGQRETHEDTSDSQWMKCKCTKCECEYKVNVSTTES